MTTLLLTTLLLAQADAIEDIDSVELLSEEDSWYDAAYPQFDRTINVLNARPMRPGSFGVNVAHRTAKGVRHEPFYNYLGFDAGGLKIGLMARYGLIDGLDVGLARLNGTVEAFDTYEFDGRYQILRQKDHAVDLAVRLGGSWFAEKDNQRLGYFAQLLVDRLLYNRVIVSAALMHHSSSTSFSKQVDDEEASTAAALGLDLRLSGSLALDMELSSTLAGYGGEFPAFSIGPKVVTNRHAFSVVVSNSQYILADGIVANTDRKAENVILGFNIIREL